MNTKEENNKVIAKFMGLTRKSIKGGFLKNGVLIKYTNLKYHTSWDWLMEVVEKIESLFSNYGKYSNIQINSKNVAIQISSLENKIIFYESIEYTNYSKIEAVYNACVEFIKYYNDR